MRGLVIFDRDGTIIDFHRDTELGVVTPAFHPQQLRFMPGALDAMRSLRDWGFALGLATNQPGAAKGELPRDAIESTMRALEARLKEEGIELAGIEMCLHHPTGGDRGDASLVRSCECRKPKPGMLLRLLERTGTSADRSWMIGDTPTDVLAARAAGMRAALVSPRKRCELCPMVGRELEPLGTPPEIWEPSLLDVARRVQTAQY